MVTYLVEEELDLMECAERKEIERPLSHYKLAIAEFLFEYVRWLDVRVLWRTGRTTFFRVNRWALGERVGDARIAKSDFLAVDDLCDGLKVRRPVPGN